ncbi:glycine cleavage system H protein-like [Zophobas morio]|jgi:glycine cleavage system H protein|uniref:glycine cleavage system H protein-like n=1 Tax=Zophobas morio TaxID=2755281 RepID=UPI0030828964
MNLLPAQNLSRGIVLNKLLFYKSVKFFSIWGRLYNTWYTDNHQWIKVKNNTGFIGLTEHAQQFIGELSYIELGGVGKHIKKGECLGFVESSKAATDIISPVTGEITEVNEKVLQNPAGLAYGSKEWLLKVNLNNEEELKGHMNEEEYFKFIHETDKLQ